MLDNIAKQLFISVLEYKIDSIFHINVNCREGIIDSLTDVLKKAQAGLYDWYFDYSYEPIGDDDSIWESTQKWRARKEQMDTDFYKRVGNMTEDEYELCIEDYRSSAQYFSGRVQGYDMADKMIYVITT